MEVNSWVAVLTKHNIWLVSRSWWNTFCSMIRNSFCATNVIIKTIFVEPNKGVGMRVYMRWKFSEGISYNYNKLYFGLTLSPSALLTPPLLPPSLLPLPYLLPPPPLTVWLLPKFLTVSVSFSLPLDYIVLRFLPQSIPPISECLSADEILAEARARKRIARLAMCW